MKKRLLNISKNLIIIFTLVFIFINIPTSVFAAEIEVNNLIKQTVSGWYLILRDISIIILLVLLAVAGFKILLSGIADKKALYKELIVDWLIGLFLVFFIHYLMFYALNLNQKLIDKSREFGNTLSGIDTENLDDEVTIYESAMSKAYEIKFTSGTIGMILYMMLVFYTYKFVFVYAKRFINIIVLILIAPILCVLNACKKIIVGTGGLLLRWFKEFIYNVFLQSLHAFFYASLVGLTINLSSNIETSLGALLTLVIFGFIFKIDGFIRKLFNVVGGSSVVKRVDVIGGVKDAVKFGMNAKQGLSEFSEAPGSTSDKLMALGSEKLEGFAQNLNPEAMYGRALKFKNDAVNNINDAFATIRGENVRLDDEKEEKKPIFLDKNLKGGVAAAVKVTSNLTSKLKKRLTVIAEEVKKKKDDLQQNFEMSRKLKKILKAHTKKSSRRKGQGNMEQFDFDSMGTVLNLAKSAKEVTDELKQNIEDGTSDLVATVYSVEGPQAFLYSDYGSPYMGMSVLAYAKYDESASNIINLSERRRNLSLRGTSKSNQKAKVYKFSRFNGKSVKTITQCLNQRMIENSKYLSTMNKVAGYVSVGNLALKGGDYTQTQESTIKYTAKINSARSMKQSTVLELEKYRERKQDARFAIVRECAKDVKDEKNNIMRVKLNRVNSSSNQEVAVGQLSDMGKATQIDSNNVILFGKQAVKIAGIQKSTMKSSVEKPSTSSVGVKEEVVEVKEKETEKDKKSEEAITDEIIMETAVNFGVTKIEKLDVKSEEVQTKIVDKLIEKGIVPAEIKNDDKAKSEIIEGIEDRKDSITQEEYFDNVMEKEVGRIAKEEHITSQADLEKIDIKDKEEKLSDTVKSIAKATVAVANEELKMSLKEGFKDIVADPVKEMAEDTLEDMSKMAGIKSASDFKNDLKNVTHKLAHVLNENEEKDSNSDEEDEGEIIVFIHGAIKNEGRYKVKNTTKIYELIKLAGGLTDNADISGINTYEVVKSGQLIVIPTKKDSDDFEEMIERCRPVVEEQIKNYMLENNIVDAEALRKLVHKNMLSVQIRKLLKNEDINKQQIDELIEQRIKEIKKIRDSFNKVKKDAVVVEINKINPKDEDVEKERLRKEKSIENTEESKFDRLIEEVTSDTSTEENNEDYDESSVEADERLKGLLEEMHEQGEKILVRNYSSNDPKQQQAREFYFDDTLTADQRMNRLLGRL